MTYTKTREHQNHVQNTARKKLVTQNSLIFCSFMIYATTVHKQLRMELSYLTGICKFKLHAQSSENDSHIFQTDLTFISIATFIDTIESQVICKNQQMFTRECEKTGSSSESSPKVPKEFSL